MLADPSSSVLSFIAGTAGTAGFAGSDDNVFAVKVNDFHFKRLVFFLLHNEHLLIDYYLNP